MTASEGTQDIAADLALGYMGTLENSLRRDGCYGTTKFQFLETFNRSRNVMQCAIGAQCPLVAPDRTTLGTACCKTSEPDGGNLLVQSW